MRQPNVILASLIVWSIACSAPAREWHSADGQRTFQAGFVALAGTRLTVAPANGSPVVLDLALLSLEDQTFARATQQSVDEAAKLVPITFEIQHVLDDGWICLAGKQAEPKQGPWIFSGDPFLWLTTDEESAKQGDRIQNQRIFPAGLRTFHPTAGEPILIRAYAANAELAAADSLAILSSSAGDVTKQAPPVYEPSVEISVTRGLGLAVGKAGLVVVSLSLLKDADSIVIHANKNRFPAKVEKQSEKQGFALLSCATTLEPGRFAARKEIELGQPVFAVSFVLGSTKKTLTQPTVSKGIISRVAGKSGPEFQHDAAVASDCPGGFILGEKGDVLGIFFESEKTAAPKETPARGKAVTLNTAVCTEALIGFLESIPNLNPSRVAASTPDLGRSVELLRASTVLVTVTRKVTKIPAAGGGGFSMGGSGTRHNAKCRYFSAAKPCGPDDGKPCKICGG